MANRESIAFSGRIGEIIHTEQPDGRVFERYRRPPGTRLIIVSPDKKILVTREHRQEAVGVDLRLPGGKVRDTLAEYHALLASGADLTGAAGEAAALEAKQEAGLLVRNLQLLTVATAGATVEWDLFYFQTSDYSENPDGQELEPGESIEVTWMGAPEIQDSIARGEMQEWRSVGVLLGLVLPTLP